jgi:Holliday junction resolvasome RuvABC endonuclease subunit
MADLTHATSAREAIPDLRPVVRANRVMLALDLGTTTGWALHGIDGLITSGTASFRPGRFDGGGMRYLRFTNWLTEIDRLSGPVAAIWFEEVRRHAATDAAHVYGGLMATLTAWAELRGIPYEGVPVGTIKRHATGKGNANKDAMMAAARARGFSPADDNEADAIAILLWAMETRREVCMSGMRFTPKATAVTTPHPDEVKRDGWQEQGVLAVSIRRRPPDLARA